MERLPRSFYSRPTLEVAKDLLGKFLVFEGKVGRIVETEGYLGPEDLASHARHLSRKRNYLMFGPPGYAYVFITYGMHYLLNITTEPKGTAGAVLIRAVEPVHGMSLPTDGPGRLTRSFGVTTKQNGWDVVSSSLYLKDPGDNIEDVKTSPRIGVDYAREYSRMPWRFFLDHSYNLSKNEQN